ncbi:AraC family transcriptional regulator [Parendozoicomonas haliclonae]|nr:AraC family transcriptional regulator [Parendozoicomonas haliclonae]
MASRVFKEQPLFPGNELQRIDELLSQEGISRSSLLMGTGLPETCLSDINILLSWEQFDIIYRNVYRLSQHPHIGLLVGSSLDITRWGVLGMAMSSARDIDHALGVANYYRHIVRSPYDYIIARIRDGLRVKLARCADVHPAIDQVFLMEVFLMGTHAIIEDLLDSPFHFQEVGLAYPPPAYADLYQEFFRCPVHFNCQESYYIIGDAFLRMPLPKSNPINYRIAKNLCHEKQKQIDSYRTRDTVIQIQELLANQEGSISTLESVAESLGISARTVRRKLAEKNTNFRELYNEDRKRKALDYMHNSTLDTESIAALLGFSDTASFRKAFKRWTGQNPREYMENSPHPLHEPF